MQNAEMNTLYCKIDGLTKFYKITTLYFEEKQYICREKNFCVKLKCICLCKYKNTELDIL